MTHDFESFLEPILSRVQTAQREFGGVYIAVMGLDHYELEIEVSEGEIAGSYPLETDSLEEARAAAQELEQSLKSKGIVVFQAREGWEAAIEQGLDID